MNVFKGTTLATLIALFAYPINIYAIKTKEPTNQLTIQFEPAEKYSDIDVGFYNDDRNLSAVSEPLRAEFQQVANKYLPSGYSLAIDIHNIDLAGDRSPLTSLFGNYRVYTDVFPPRIAFSYAVYDSQEKRVAEGFERASDLAFTFKLRGAQTWSEEEAPYLTELVRGWASKELRRAVEQ